jgi:hypothetical protein
MAQVKMLEDERNTLITEKSLDAMKIVLQQKEIRKLNEEIELLRNSAQQSAGIATAGIRTIKGGKIFLDKNIDLKENLDCRMIKSMPRNKKLMLTQKAPEASLFPGFGVKLIDLQTSRPEKFINTSNKVLNDFSFDSNETLVITASKEQTCKTYNILSGSSVATFTPNTTPIWCCAFDEERQQNIYLGGQNGIIYAYDIRQTSEVQRELSDLTNRSPIKHVIPMKKTENFPLGGFFVVHVRGIIFYEYHPGTEIIPTTLHCNDATFSVSYDDRTEMLLITKSPTAQLKQTRHCLMKLIKENNIPVLQEIYSFNGSSATLPALSRPTQIKVPDGLILANYLQDTKTLQIRSPSIGLFHQAVMSEAINDICPIYNGSNSAQNFVALSHSRCRFFKANLDY